MHKYNNTGHWFICTCTRQAMNSLCCSTALSGKNTECLNMECATVRRLPATVMRKKKLPQRLLLMESRHYRMSHNSRPHYTVCWRCCSFGIFLPLYILIYEKFTHKTFWSQDTTRGSALVLKECFYFDIAAC